MLILNLDREFKPYMGEEIQFESSVFSGGEPHVKLKSEIENGTQVTVTTRIRCFNDFGMLLVAVDALKRTGAVLDKLFIPYFPGARQDRLMVKGEPLTVKLYAELINNLGFRVVQVFDPHSEVTSALLNNCETIVNHQFVSLTLKMIGHDVCLISPDGGALKKIDKLSKFLGGIEVIECSKKRNVMNGMIEGFKVYSEDLNGKNCLIVDDICDGGATFIGLAKELKMKNAGDLYLAVSHGIFSKGIEGFDCFKSVFCTDSFKQVDFPLVVQINLAKVLN
mgnify:CR=1 FL=1